MDKGTILDALYNHYKESIFVTDSEGRVVFANKVAEERLHSDFEFLMGKSVNELIKAGIYSKSTVLEAMKTKLPVIGPINDDKTKITFSHSVPVLDEDNNVTMVVTSNMSIEHNEEWEKVISATQDERDKLKRELDFLRLRDQRVLIFESQIMKSILKTIEAIAPTDCNVVLSGKSGTGKDMIAMLIHEKSRRSVNAYICINCAAVPENLLESELFGYEGGAFTGALTEGKIGLFEAVSGGTLFLDEIGEMSLSLQSKLLRVMENREVRRIGGVKNIPVNVRIICATNANLKQLVKEKKFREDLFYRLNVFNIELPRLKDRKDDIIPIANMFLTELNGKYNQNKKFSELTLKTMLEYNWPGNIRELRNVVERIYFINQEDEVIFSPMLAAEYSHSNERNCKGIKTCDFKTLKEYMSYTENTFIKKVLEECGGSIGKTANRLGIHRSVLYRKLNKK